jgi:hypothetical protein
LTNTKNELKQKSNELRNIEASLKQYMSGFDQLNKENREIIELKKKSDQSFQKMLSELHDKNLELTKLVNVMKPVYESFNKKVEDYDLIEADEPVSIDAELIETEEDSEPEETLEKTENKNGYFSWLYSKKDNKEDVDDATIL